MSNTRQTIIEIADELIRSRGYNAFSYTDISSRLDLKNAAIHYHFPTKHDLALAVIQYHTQSFHSFEERTKEKTPLQRINLFLNFYTSIHLSGKICIIGAFATDWNSLSDDTKTELEHFTNLVQDWLSTALNEGVENKSITINEAPEVEALSIITNILAATQLARINGSEQFATVKKSIINRITPKLTY